MTQNITFRYRIRFGKHGALRWTGHLDVQRAWERTFRRAGLPLCYSRGFHRHPRLVFGAPLPLGFAAEGELLDAYLTEPQPAPDLLSRLQRAAPPGLSAFEAQLIDPKAPTVTVAVHAAEYTVPLTADQLPPIRTAVERLLAAPHLPRERRNKPYDLRPLVEHLDVTAPADAPPALAMRLACREAATGRPEEVLAQLNLDPADHRICRTRLLTHSPARPPLPGGDGQSQPLGS